MAASLSAPSAADQAGIHAAHDARATSAGFNMSDAERELRDAKPSNPVAGQPMTDEFMEWQRRLMTLQFAEKATHKAPRPA